MQQAMFAPQPQSRPQQQQPQYPPGGMPPPMPVVKMPAKSTPWQIEMCDACTSAPGPCCAALCCPPCVVYAQRKRALAFLNEPYSCCQRDSLPHPTGCCCCPGEFYSPPEHPMPARWPPAEEPPILRDFHCTLCLEACCCPALAMLGTRWMMQHKLFLHDHPCDKVLLCAGAGASVCAGCGCLDGHDGTAASGSGGGAAFACATAQVDVELAFQEAKYTQFLREGPRAQQFPPPPGPAHQVMLIQGPSQPLYVQPQPQQYYVSPQPAPAQYVMQPHQQQQPQQQYYMQPQQQQLSPQQQYVPLAPSAPQPQQGHAYAAVAPPYGQAPAQAPPPYSSVAPPPAYAPGGYVPPQQPQQSPPYHQEGQPFTTQ